MLSASVFASMLRKKSKGVLEVISRVVFIVKSGGISSKSSYLTIGAYVFNWEKWTLESIKS